VEKPATDISRIKDLANELFEEIDTLARQQAFEEACDAPDKLDFTSPVDFFSEVRRFESRLIKLALEQAGGNQKRAARFLGLPSTTLNHKIKAYGLQ
jgi:DNA-binding NtrC family response regulator